LFADNKGSTELIRELDPEEARAVIDPVLQLMMDAVHRYDGYVVQSAGDGIFALFGAPVAHEDHPQRAVHAAIAIRDALRRRGGDGPGRPGVEVRIGINTGEVVLRLVHTGGHTEYKSKILSLRKQLLCRDNSCDERGANRLLHMHHHPAPPSPRSRSPRACGD
jgi:class 3 adenylate cyclase